MKKEIKYVLTSKLVQGLTILKNTIKIKTGDIMIIMFVRHGEAIDDKLTELGKRQCELMVEQNEAYNFSKIYCSTTNRCRQTAKYFEEKLKLSVEYLDKIKDRELLNHEPQNEDEQEWYDNYLNKSYSHKNPEGCFEFLKRNFAEFDKIIKNHKPKNENVILVAHSCTFYAIQEYFNHCTDDEINYYRLSNCSRVYFEIK